MRWPAIQASSPHLGVMLGSGTINFFLKKPQIWHPKHEPLRQKRPLNLQAPPSEARFASLRRRGLQLKSDFLPGSKWHFGGAKMPWPGRGHLSIFLTAGLHHWIGLNCAFLWVQSTSSPCLISSCYKILKSCAWTFLDTYRVVGYSVLFLLSSVAD